MRNLKKTLLFLLLTFSIVSCELGIKREEMLPSKAPDAISNSQGGDEIPVKPKD